MEPNGTEPAPQSPMSTVLAPHHTLLMRAACVNALTALHTFTHSCIKENLINSVKGKACFIFTCIHSGSMVGPGDVRFSRCPVLSYVNTVPAALYSPFHWMVQPPFRKYLLGLSLRSARKLPASATSSMRMSRAPSGIRPMST